MSGVEEALKTEFPEAKDAEVKRFVSACQNGNKSDDMVKEEAEKMLENYLDWRSCYGLDYDENKVGERDDAADWKWAIEKTIEVNESAKKAEELKKQMEEEAEKEKNEKAEVNYDVDISDSQKTEDDKETGDKEEAQEGDNKTEGEKDAEPEGGEGGEAADTEKSDDDKKRELAQMIFSHKDKDGSPVKDKSGHTIWHVLPALIDRSVAQADFYGLALCLYLDRKLNRESEEKITVLMDVRSGGGWPNPPAYMMIKFVRTITQLLQVQYPERLQSLIIYPVPWAAMTIFAAMKVVFRYEIMEKVVLVSGPAETLSPLPKEKLQEHLGDDVLELTEQFRLGLFAPPETTAEPSEAPKDEPKGEAQDESKSESNPESTNESKDEKVDSGDQAE